MIQLPAAPLPGIYAIPSYARRVTVTWPTAQGAAILVLLDVNGQVVSLCPFTAQIVPFAIQGKDFYQVPESARWWSLSMVTAALGPNVRPRVTWELHV